MPTLHALTVPKLGLTMKEGAVAVWHVPLGGAVTAGEPVADIETSKITASYDAPFSGVMRRQVAELGKELPVGALIAVVAEGDASEAEIDAFIASFTPEEKV
jgi:pyruvate dehydrogenase E2 component (dihydrolipoamide acetyltransferase)